MNYKHGHAGGHASPTYRSWSGMHTRCAPDFAQAADYHDRGIKVDPRWDSFDNFLADMGPCPAGLTIERDDNDKGYSPDNCRWATRKEQSRNRRGRRMVEFRDQSMLLAAAIELSGVSVATFETRVYSRKWSIERALNTPVRKYERKC